MAKDKRVVHLFPTNLYINLFSTGDIFIPLCVTSYVTVYPIANNKIQQKRQPLSAVPPVAVPSSAAARSKSERGGEERLYEGSVTRELILWLLIEA
jgi:hypothetical protein